MFKEKRVQISFSILLILIVASTLYYKDKLNRNNIMSDKSYAYVENSEVFNNILEETVNKISLQDQTFNENDYKITYDRIDNHNGKIIFTYVIDGVVETNKSYTAIINKSKVEDIIFNSIKSIDESTIIKRVKKFNENKKSSMEANYEEIPYDPYDDIVTKDEIFDAINEAIETKDSKKLKLLYEQERLNREKEAFKKEEQARKSRSNRYHE